MDAIINSLLLDKEFISDMLESSFDGLFITDNNGVVLYVNKAYEQLAEIDRADYVGKSMTELIESGRMKTYISKEVARTKKTITARETLVSGKEVIITGSPVLNRTGDCIAVVTNVRDVTQIIKLEKEAQVSKELIDLYRRELGEEFEQKDIVCASDGMLKALNLARRVAKKDSTVLITGETGVGKEVIAKYIHFESNRRDNNYIRINCGAIPKNLIESELFGYTKGAFTGADPNGRMGAFELAAGGTLLLDEIGELPLETQATLLRALQDGEIHRVGDTRYRKVDVRIIAATNRNLEQMISEGRFRQDLYYRLNVITIEVPALRDRKEDIPELAEFFLRRLNATYAEEKVMTRSFKEQLQKREWPGNVRELANFIERQFIIQDGDVLNDIVQIGNGMQIEYTERMAEAGPLPKLDDAVESVEKTLVLRAMELGGTTVAAAKLLGVSQPTFSRKYSKYKEK